MARAQCGAVTTSLRRERLRLLQPTWPAYRRGSRDPSRDHAPRALSPDNGTRGLAAARGRSGQTVTIQPGPHRTLRTRDLCSQRRRGPPFSLLDEGRPVWLLSVLLATNPSRRPTPGSPSTTNGCTSLLARRLRNEPACGSAWRSFGGR